MKLALALLLTFSSVSTFASSLAENLQNKECAINFKKTITIKKKEAMVEVGEVSITSIFHNSNLKLRSGSTYPVLDVAQGTIAINQGNKLIFLCINDGDECLADLNTIQLSDVYQLSNRALKIECK